MGSAPGPCISAADILVRFHVLMNQKEIAARAPGESVNLDPGLMVTFEVRPESVSGKTLPLLECTWKNTGVSTTGKLLRSTGCMIDYQTGQTVISDVISVRLIQQSCPALAPFPLFILPKSGGGTPAACQPPSGWVKYTVLAGDTLYSLALRTGVSPNEILVSNCLPANTILAGSTLYLPAAPSSATPSLPQTPDTTLTLQAAYEEIDQQFNSLLKANLAFNKPEQMKQGETSNIELILNSSLSEEELATQIVARGGFATSTAEPGTLVAPGGQFVSVETGQIEITPRMKAVLKAEDSAAFDIQEEHDSAEQVISTQEKTVWRWAVTAKKEGTQTLELVIYRLVKYDGKDYWSEVESYKAPIVVVVTLSQQIQALDWKWIAGFILTFVGSVLGVLSWLSNKKSKPVPEGHLHGSTKKSRN